MTLRNFEIRPARWEQDQQRLRRLRTIVFIDEQSVPAELEWDGRDSACRHLIAESLAGLPIGTARVTEKFQIGRMAVLREWRGRGVGAGLLAAALAQCRSQGADKVFVHAQVSAIGFYRQSGFIVSGPIYEEAGIEHQTMWMAL